MGWFIGLMSGTSLDGVDGVVARFDGGAGHVEAHHHRPFDAHLRASCWP
jgi:anhydro-N-acetylmuramic acid kinase